MHYDLQTEVKNVTICPCCGFRFEGNLREGCEACGARSVGEALPRPEHELPLYGRSLLLAVIGSLMVLVFLTQTVVALLKRPPVSTSFWSWIAAAETAAWRLKWIAIPATIVVLWTSRKLYRSMLQTPSRFCGFAYARGGLAASTLIPLMIAVLIAVTVPERLRQRQLGIEAGIQALGYTYDRALFEYRLKYGRLPSDLSDLKQLPDPDGSIAVALNSLGLEPEKFSTAYRPTADVASRQRPVTLRGTVIRNASLSTIADDAPGEGLSFTNYELRLPGEDKLMLTEDDWIVNDGVITRAPQVGRRATTTTGPSR